ncbi:tumor necrosis factor receptor superfamily member 27 isoform X2 [Castor canadensis]|uniref:Tumor necrosis factor receptor superfamily member 27 isoform X2 n=1 Tax=Castor canadensis TaxID=51338 RepID=A0AC58LN26_CASCN
MDCQENEYWDQWGHCVTCQQCGPGQELSKDCGYGEGGDAYCTACPPRRYKSSWGHHRCQSCITCAVINRVQKTNCTATSNAICGDCLPRFYRKTRIGGLQDQECIPCTKQTPTSEVQCAFQLSLVKADAPTVPPHEATLVALVSSLLVVFTLAFLGLFFLYCKQFFNRHCQHGIPSKFFKRFQKSGFLYEHWQIISIKNKTTTTVGKNKHTSIAGGSLEFETDEIAEEESLFPMPPGQETTPESPESFTMPSCASESHSHWVHNPIECTELDLQKFSCSASNTGADTLRGNTAESSGDKLELNVPFEVPSP